MNAAQRADPPSTSLLAEGITLLRAGRPAEAEKALSLAVQAEPRSATNLTWRGICENQLARFTVAAADFQAALRLDPAMVPAHYNYALTLIKLHRTEDAIVQLQTVLAAQPEAVQALYNLSVLQESRGSFADAASNLRKAHILAPQDDDATLHLLVDDLRTNDTGETATLVEQLSGPSTIVAIQRDAGAALLEAKRFQDAESLLSTAEGRNPDIPGIRPLLARAFLGTQQDSKAIALLTRPPASPDDVPESTYLLALAYLDQGATMEATQAFEAAAKLRPKDARPLYHLGLLALGAPERRNEAEKLLRSAIALDPENPTYSLALAHFFLVQDRAQEAVAVLSTVKAAGEVEAEHHALKGVAFAALHEMAQAIHQLEQALKLDPSLALAANVLGFCYLQQGQNAKAAEYYARASELDPKRAVYAQDAALAAERANQNTEAMHFAERATTLDTENASYHVLLGKIYAAAGRKPEALQQLLRAAALDPTSDAACYLLARTYKEQGDREQALAWSNKLAKLKQEHAAAFAFEKKNAAEVIRSSRLLGGESYSEPAAAPE